MVAFRIVAVILIAAGVAALVHGRFGYTQDSKSAQIGPIELTVQERKTVDIPAWAGAGSIAVGTAILALAPKKN